ncbi:hypothetical protein KJ766_03045, partial [Patescibacteria group bacterium]|nr:hypothetical protein [Patescibacteria group bacterium]
MQKLQLKTDATIRLDVGIATTLGISRNQAQKAIKNGDILVDKKPRS